MQLKVRQMKNINEEVEFIINCDEFNPELTCEGKRKRLRLTKIQKQQLLSEFKKNKVWDPET